MSTINVVKEMAEADSPLLSSNACCRMELTSA